MKKTASRDERPTVALLLSDNLQQRVLSQDALQQLKQLAHIVSFPDGKPVQEALPSLLQEAEACITGWDTPYLSEELLEGCPKLRIIAHTAGTIRYLVTPAVFRRGIHVSHANAALAEGVAEFVVLQALYCLRRIHTYDQQLKDGKLWSQEPGRLLKTQTFGIVGTGSIGRGVIALLKPFGCSILAYDPYLSAEQARDLGVVLADLETVFASADIVSLHVPLLPETQGMIGEKQLSLLRPGTLFLNTARAGLVDEQALLHHLETGRFTAALDVFHKEPLALDSRLRSLPNVVITPHIAALTRETLHLQGQMMVDEIERFFNKQALKYAVQAEKLPMMA